MREMLSRRPPPPVPIILAEEKPPKLPPRKSPLTTTNQSPTHVKPAQVSELCTMFESYSPASDPYREQLRRQARRFSEQQYQRSILSLTSPSRVQWTKPNISVTHSKVQPRPDPQEVQNLNSSTLNNSTPDSPTIHNAPVKDYSHNESNGFRKDLSYGLNELHPSRSSLSTSDDDSGLLSPCHLPPPPPELLEDGEDLIGNHDINEYPKESYGSYKNTQSRQIGVYRRATSAAELGILNKERVGTSLRNSHTFDQGTWNEVASESFTPNHTDTPTDSLPTDSVSRDTRDDLDQRVNLFKAKCVSVMSVRDDREESDGCQSPRRVSELRRSFENLNQSRQSSSPNIFVYNKTNQSQYEQKLLEQRRNSRRSASSDDSRDNLGSKYLDNQSISRSESSMDTRSSGEHEIQRVSSNATTCNNLSVEVPVGISIIHRRQKSAEELECETRASALANQLRDHDEKLSQIISPAMHSHDVVHFMNGIFDSRSTRSVSHLSGSKSVLSPSEVTQIQDSSDQAPLDNEVFEDTLNHNSKLFLPKKEELVRSLEKKLVVLRNEKSLVHQEITENDSIAQKIHEEVDIKCTNQNEKSKFKSFMEELDKVVRLLLKLSGLLARTENSIQSLGCSDDAKKKSLLEKKQKLVERHEEAKILKAYNDRRLEKVTAMLERCLPSESLSLFSQFVSSKSSLTIDMQSIDDHIHVTEQQLHALRTNIDDCLSQR